MKPIPQNNPWQRFLRARPGLRLSMLPSPNPRKTDDAIETNLDADAMQRLLAIRAKRKLPSITGGGNGGY